MTRRRFLSFTGAAGAAFLAAGGLRPSRASACPNLDLPDQSELLAKGINQFAADLHARFARDAKGSIFFSPFSIEAALAMTAAGARGETLSEMEKTLHLFSEPHAAFGDLIDRLNGRVGSQVKRSYELSVANAIWAQKGYPWHKEFTELTRKHYGAGTVETDFAKSEEARKEINLWVETQTRKKIKDLIPAGVINDLTRMVLVNAIYFKGDWQTKFDKKNTTDAPFTLVDGKTKVDVPLMYLTSTFKYGEFDLPRGDQVQVLEMPYAGKDLSMLIYLPKDAGGVNVNRLPRWLTADKLGNLELQEKKVYVYLPRFKVESEFSLNSALVDLGMKTAFQPKKADFTGMSPSGKKLFISDVLHKAVVEVNEEGSEAAAATAVVVATDSYNPLTEPATFRADRPFVFTIRENKTGTVLFLGRYSGPK